MFSTLPDRFFRSVWAWFIPYVLVYTAAIGLRVPVQTLKGIFWGLHVALATGLVVWIATQKKTPVKAHLLFGGALALFFFTTVPYLEFPSDPWEHYRRLLSWSAFDQLKDNSIYSKFTYFWGWTLLDPVPVAYRPLALHAYATFWCLVVAHQWYLMARRLGFSQSWAFAQVVATVCFWGTNLFGFYNYYSLSSTMLAYAAYLAAFRIWLEFLDGERQNLWAIPFALLLCLANHRQEVLFFLCLASSLYGYEALARRRTIRPAELALAFGAVTVLGCLIHFFWTRAAFANATGYFTRFGLLKVWSEATPVLETLSLAGLCGLAAAAWRFSREPRLSFLTWAPLAWLMSGVLFPLTLRAEDLYTSYRILYAFPPSLALVAFLKWLWETNRRPAFCGAVAVLLGFALMPRYPWRGKLWLHYFRVPPTLSLAVAEAGLARLDEDKALDKRCLMASDEVTEFLLAVHFQHPIRWSARPVNKLPDREFAAPQHFDYYYKQQGWCGFVTFVPGPIPRSRVANLSKHWFEDAVETNWKTPAGFEALWREGLNQGWKEKPGIPGFRLLVP